MECSSVLDVKFYSLSNIISYVGANKYYYNLAISDSHKFYDEPVSATTMFKTDYLQYCCTVSERSTSID